MVSGCCFMLVRIKKTKWVCLQTVKLGNGSGKCNKRAGVIRRRAQLVGKGCKRKKCSNFLFVSSIATIGFPCVTHLYVQNSIELIKIVVHIVLIRYFVMSEFILCMIGIIQDWQDLRLQ